MLRVVMSSIEWEPIVLMPITLAAWLTLFWWMIRSTGRQGPVAPWLFRFKMRLRRRQRLEHAASHAKRHDAEDNELTTPPAGEHLWWSCLWMVEICTPAHAEALVRGAQRLGWDSDRFMIMDAVDWTKSARASGGLHSARLGFFQPAHALLWPGAIRVDMPECFAFLSPMLLQLGPGVTAVVTQFGLSDHEQTALERVLRETAEGRAEAVGWTGIRAYGARHVKEERLAAERQRIRDQASEWMGKNFRGIFAGAGEEPPTWDLIATEKEPLVADWRAPRDWRQTVGLAQSELWTLDSSSNKALMLALPPFTRPAAPCATFTGRRQPLIAGLGEHRRDSLFSVAQEVDEQCAPLLGLWGSVDAVDLIDRTLSQARDQRLPSRSSYRATRAQLQQLREVVLPAASDLEVFEGLAESLKSERAEDWFQMYAGDFSLLTKGAPLSLLTWLRKRLAEDAASARARAASVATGLRAYSEALVAGSNLGLQRRVLWLSILVAIMTAVTVWAALRELEAADGQNKPDGVGGKQDVRHP